MSLRGTLYHSLYWSSSTTLHLMHELNIVDKFVIKNINGMEEVKSAEYKAINPRQLIPYFKDEQGVGMGESLALAIRILDEYDTNHRLLAPPGQTMRYKQLEAALFAVTTLKPSVAALHDPELSAERRTEQFHKLNGMYADHIQYFFASQDKGPFVFGAEHCVVDYFFCFELLGLKFADLSFNPELKDSKLALLEVPCVSRFLEAILEVPSTKAVYPMDAPEEGAEKEATAQ